ncbi:MAG: antibiotic biosynthesis monooxygenase [Alphaproteobacteria bacterium]|nr:antibiotic biosynthesis monooxygenase [Alphaproteobacteria bacterium]
MSDNVHWLLEISIKPGQLDTFKSVMAEMVAATNANEPDTLIYEWFISEDQQTCHIYERYVDSAATMIHLATFGEKFAERILATVEPTRFVVYGNPDETVRGALAGFGAVHMEEIGGFAR